jgi:asparagine synthase (glutamine-hydrolysing)
MIFLHWRWYDRGRGELLLVRDALGVHSLFFTGQDAGFAFASEVVPDLRCFTIDVGGGDGETEDLSYARRVAAHLRVPLDVVRVDATRMAGDLQAMVPQLDEPLADPAPLNVLYYISRLARERGIKVQLSGTGGDDLFTGYRRHLDLSMESAWDWLPAPARAGLGAPSARMDLRGALRLRMRRLFANAGGTGRPLRG